MVAAVVVVAACTATLGYSGGLGIPMWLVVAVRNSGPDSAIGRLAHRSKRVVLTNPHAIGEPTRVGSHRLAPQEQGTRAVYQVVRVRARSRAHLAKVQLARITHHPIVSSGARSLKVSSPAGPIPYLARVRTKFRRISTISGSGSRTSMG